MTPRGASEHAGLLSYAMSPGSPSFTEFLALTAPHLLPTAGSGALSAEYMPPHGTTIVAAVFDGGVVMAGDRRATAGNLIAQRDIEKVYATDDFSIVGIAGTAGLAIDLVRLYQVELEHYEKIEGTQLTLDGKANRLATMLRGNLAQALQGLAVVPLFAGFDTDEPNAANAGKIYSFDVTGGRYPETYYEAIGSGSVFARGSLKKRWRAGMTRDEVVHVLVEALYDAADDDSATGGPDLGRRIFPTVRVASAAGVSRVGDEELTQIVGTIIAHRTATPGS